MERTRGVVHPQVFELENNGKLSAGGHQNLEYATEVVTAISPFADGVTSIGVQSADGYVRSPHSEVINEAVRATLVSHRYQLPRKEKGTAIFAPAHAESYWDPEVAPPWTRGKAYMGWQDLAPLSFGQLEAKVGKRLARWYLERDARPLTSDYRRHIYTKHTSEAVMHGYPVQDNDVPLKRFYTTLLANGYSSVPRIRREGARERAREVFGFIAQAAEAGKGWDELTMTTIQHILPPEFKVDTFSLVAMFGREPAYVGAADPHALLDQFLVDPHASLQKYNHALESAEGTLNPASLTELPFFAVHYDPELQCYVRRGFGLIPESDCIRVMVNGVELGRIALPGSRADLFEILEARLGTVYVVPKAAALLVALSQGFNMHREGAYDYEGVSRQLTEQMGMQFSDMITVEHDFWEAIAANGDAVVFQNLNTILIAELTDFVYGLAQIYARAPEKFAEYLVQVGYSETNALEIAEQAGAGEWLEKVQAGKLDEAVLLYCEHYGLPVKVYSLAIEHALPLLQANLEHLVEAIHNSHSGLRSAEEIVTAVADPVTQSILGTVFARQNLLQQGEEIVPPGLDEVAAQMQARRMELEATRQHLQELRDRFTTSRDKLQQAIQSVLNVGRTLPARLAQAEQQHLSGERRMGGVTPLYGVRSQEPEQVYADYNLGAVWGELAGDETLAELISQVRQFTLPGMEDVDASLNEQINAAVELANTVEAWNNTLNQEQIDAWLHENLETVIASYEFIRNIVYLSGKGSAADMTIDLRTEITIHEGKIKLPKVMHAYPRVIKKLLQVGGLVWNPVLGQLERIDFDPATTVQAAFPPLSTRETEWMQTVQMESLSKPDQKLFNAYRSREQLWIAANNYAEQRERAEASLVVGQVKSVAHLQDGKSVLDIDIGERNATIVTTAVVNPGTVLAVALPGSVIKDDKGKTITVSAVAFTPEGQRVKQPTAQTEGLVISEGSLVLATQIGAQANELAVLSDTYQPGMRLVDVESQVADFYARALPTTESLLNMTLAELVEIADQQQLPVPFLVVVLELMTTGDITAMQRDVSSGNPHAIQKLQKKVASELRQRLRKNGNELPQNHHDLQELQHNMVSNAEKSIRTLVDICGLALDCQPSQIMEALHARVEEINALKTEIAVIETEYRSADEEAKSSGLQYAEQAALLLMRGICLLIQEQNTLSAVRTPHALSVYALGGHELFRKLIASRTVNVVSES